MTNILAGLILSFSTNCVGVATQPDGSRICEYTIIANVECNHVMPDGTVLRFITQTPYGSRLSRIEPPLPTPPPLPQPLSLVAPSQPLLFSAASSGAPFSLLPPHFANGGPDEENASQMFRIDFPTETNRIYALEASRDFVHWEPRPPEIDGTGAPDFFFDANNAGESYRVMSRVGVLPQ